jgi:hypothetical protein
MFARLSSESGCVAFPQSVTVGSSSLFFLFFFAQTEDQSHQEQPQPQVGRDPLVYLVLCTVRELRLDRAHLPCGEDWQTQGLIETDIAFPPLRRLFGSLLTLESSSKSVRRRSSWLSCAVWAPTLPTTNSRCVRDHVPSRTFRLSAHQMPSQEGGRVKLTLTYTDPDKGKGGGARAAEPAAAAGGAEETEEGAWSGCAQ